MTTRAAIRTAKPVIEAESAPRHATCDLGLGMIGLLASLAILAVMAVVAVKELDSATKSPGTSSANSSTSGATGASGGSPNALIAGAADTAAQANLRSALGLADAVALSAGGYGLVTAQSLAQQGGGLAFSSTPSTSASRVSVAATGRSNGGITLAVRSASGTCWFVWRSDTATVYGAETGETSCAAPAFGTAPVDHVVGDKVIGWQPGTFPAS